MHKTVHSRKDGYKSLLVSQHGLTGSKARVAIEPDTGLFTAGVLIKAHRSRKSHGAEVP